MNRSVLFFCLAAAMTLQAQTSPTPSAPAAKSSAATHASTTTAHPASSTAYKLPPGEKRVPGIPKMAFAMRYQDIKTGAGAEGESGKLWHMKYKGWRAADGVVFDSWENNRRPEMGKDGKPVIGPDGKPVMGEPQPLAFPQGTGRLIPGFDYGIAGMRVGGKRRLFIPWQLAYGNRTLPDRPDHPGIPAKSDLVFDVELVDVTDVPAPPQRPMMPQGARPMPGAPGAQPRPVPPPPAGAPATAPAPAPTPGTQSAPAVPTTPVPAKPAPPPASQPAQPSPPPQSH